MKLLMYRSTGDAEGEVFPNFELFPYFNIDGHQAWRKQYRVDPTKIGSSAKGAGTLEGSGGMLPREILKFSFSKIHI